MGHRDEDEWLDQVNKEMGRLAGELAGARLTPARSRGWSPRVDVLETSGHVVLRVELAGVATNKFSLNYSATKHTLTIKGARSEESVIEDERPIAHQLEIEFGAFWREIQLPDVSLDVEDVRASFKGGMLFIVVPKTDAPPKPFVVRRTITIQRL